MTMSEQTPEAAPATETTEAATTEITPAAAEAPAPTETVEHWREMARKQEQRAKANADAAKRLAEIEDAQKTEQQRLADRQTAIERERDEARADGLRYRAANKHRIDEDYLDLLGSGDEEEILNRAERIGDLLKVRAENEQLKAELEALKAGKPAPLGGRPVEALKPGATAVDIKPTEDDAYPADFLTRRQRERSASTT